MTQPITTLPPLPHRPDESHKGTFGKVLLIAGSQGMSGAAILSGLGALRGGAGLVYLAVPESILPIVAAAEPSYLTIPLPDDFHADSPALGGSLTTAALETIHSSLAGQDAAGLGPGLGQSEGVRQIVQELYQSVELPLVVDADGLNALARNPERLSEHAGVRILTPHPGEFARLGGSGEEEGRRERGEEGIQGTKETGGQRGYGQSPRPLCPPVSSVPPSPAPSPLHAQRIEAAMRFAAAHDVVLVLKGRGTVVTDGERVYVNSTGNSGMATGGTGDVLTGLITALLGQRVPPFEAAQLGVYLHGLAGDLAARKLSKPGLIASDLAWWLTQAWKEVVLRGER